VDNKITLHTRYHGVGYRRPYVADLPFAHTRQDIRSKRNSPSYPIPYASDSGPIGLECVKDLSHCSASWRRQSAHSPSSHLILAHSDARDGVSGRPYSVKASPCIIGAKASNRYLSYARINHAIPSYSLNVKINSIARRPLNTSRLIPHSFDGRGAKVKQRSNKLMK
jgi:hypothetical protein